MVEHVPVQVAMLGVEEEVLLEQMLQLVVERELPVLFHRKGRLPCVPSPAALQSSPLVRQEQARGRRSLLHNLSGSKAHVAPKNSSTPLEPARMQVVEPERLD